MFPIRKVDQLQAEDIEYLGTKRKFWFTSGGQRYLFKAEERGTGEDWAEKVVCELARCLGIPHVEYELAHQFEGQTPIQPGVICPSFAPRPLALVMGNQLLLGRDPAYPAATDRKFGIREYTVDAVAEVVATLHPPAPEWMRATPAGVTTALGVFIGYMLLDAWVANQDRHHQNWGAIQQAGVLRLSPTYDHGASLARNLTDEDRKSRLETRDKNRTVEHFAGKARSGFYATPKDDKTMFALDVFRRFGERDIAAARIWLGKVVETSQNAMDAILAEVPPQRMSPVTREFTLELLTINQRRLLESLSP
jgi:HipA-like C-terminal domain